VSQQNINFGTFPDDPGSDAIRIAFQKVQNNFNQLFTSLQSEAVLSIVAGPGISINSPTGNVLISANLAQVQVQTTTLSIGRGSNGSQFTTINDSSQVLFVDLPSIVNGVTDINVTGNLTANSGNVTGNIVNANTATVSGNLNSGNLLTSGNLIVTGNANIGNIGAVNGTFTANVSVTGNISAGNIIVQSGKVISNVVSANSIAASGNINASGNIQSQYFIGNGSQLTGVLATPGPYIINGTSNVNIPSVNGNVSVSVGGTSNVVVISSNLVNVTGSINATGNLTTNVITANTALFTSIQGTLTTNAQPNITSVGNLTTLVVVGNISGANIIGNHVGNGSGITYINASNVVGNVANAIYASSANFASISTVAGTVTTNAQPNITSVGNLTTLYVTGNIISGTTIFGTFSGNGYSIISMNAANVVGSVSNSNAANTLLTTASTANTAYPTFVSSSSNGYYNATTVAGISANLANNSIAATTFIGALSGLATTASNAINSVVTTQNSGIYYPTFINGNATGNYALASNSAISANLANGALSAPTFVGTLSGSATTAGTVTTNAQPNITSVGLLSGLAVGNATSNTQFGNGTINAFGNIQGQYFIGNGSQLTGISVSAGSTIINGNSNVNIPVANGNVNISVSGNANVLSVYASGATVNGNFSATTVSGNIITSAQPNITSLGNLTRLNMAGIANLGPISNIIITGGTTNQVLISNGAGGLNWISATGLTVAPGTNTQVLFNDGGNFAAQAGLTFNKTTNALSVTGNVNGANGIFTNLSGNASGLTNVPAANLTGNLPAATQSNITQTGTLSSLIVSGNINAGNISAPSGTVTGNLLTGTLTSASQPNITSVGTLTSLSVTGNITGTNVNGNYFGNGAAISSITGANVTGAVANATYATSSGTSVIAGTVTTNAQPNITSVGSLSSLIVSGNINAGNISAPSGTVTGNLLTGTLTSASQPNITSVGTLSSLSVTGNITGTNINGNHFGNGAAISSITGANVIGTVGNATYATSAGSSTTAGTVTTNAQPNITSVGSLSSLIVSGNINAGNISAPSGTVTGNLLTGTLTSASQPNITSVGTLTTLIVRGAVNLGLVGNIVITGGTNGQFLQTNGNGSLSWGTGLTVSAGDGISITTSNSIATITAIQGTAINNAINTLIGGADANNNTLFLLQQRINALTVRVAALEATVYGNGGNTGSSLDFSSVNNSGYIALNL
jgi:hypothetical protein